MLSKKMREKAFQLQQFNATKQLFIAVANGKSVLLYGTYGSGKTTLIDENEKLLKEYTPVYMNINSEKKIKELLRKEGLFIVEGLYSGRSKLHIPRDDIVEIHLPMTLGERTNELTYV